jgi:hypothetical protein
MGGWVPAPEMLDRMIPLNEQQLRRLVRDYVSRFHEDGILHGVVHDTPNRRPLRKQICPEATVISSPQVSGPHHRCFWQQAAWGVQVTSSEHRRHKYWKQRSPEYYWSVPTGPGAGDARSAETPYRCRRPSCQSVSSMIANWRWKSVALHFAGPPSTAQGRF